MKELFYDWLPTGIIEDYLGIIPIFISYTFIVLITGVLSYIFKRY